MFKSFPYLWLFNCISRFLTNKFKDKIHSQVSCHQPMLLMIPNATLTDEGRSSYENVRTNKKLQVVKCLWGWFGVFVCLVHFLWESQEGLLKAGNFHNPSLMQHGYSTYLAHSSWTGKGLQVPPGPRQCSWQMLCDNHSLPWVISDGAKVPGVCGLEHSSVQRQPGAAEGSLTTDFASY